MLLFYKLIKTLLTFTYFFTNKTAFYSSPVLNERKIKQIINNFNMKNYKAILSTFLYLQRTCLTSTHFQLYHLLFFLNFLLKLNSKVCD